MRIARGTTMTLREAVGRRGLEGRLSQALEKKGQTNEREAMQEAEDQEAAVAR